jgi:hypothetical protein
MSAALEHTFPAHTTEHDIAEIVATSRRYSEDDIDLVRRLTELFDDRSCFDCEFGECPLSVDPQDPNP